MAYMWQQVSKHILKYSVEAPFIRWFFEKNQQEVQTLEGMASWLSAHACHISQSSMYAYTRARLGLMMGKAFSEEIFSRALFESALRAQVYTLTDLSLLLALNYRQALDEISLRTSIAKVQEHAQSLVDETSYLQDTSNTRQEEPLSPQELESLKLVVPLSIEDAKQEASKRFDLMLPIVTTPHTKTIIPRELVQFSAQKLFDLIPLNEQMKYLDEEMVINNTSLRLMRFYEDITRDKKREKFIKILEEIA